jgi:hypothetical protein
MMDHGFLTTFLPASLSRTRQLLQSSRDELPHGRLRLRWLKSASINGLRDDGGDIIGVDGKTFSTEPPASWCASGEAGTVGDLKGFSPRSHEVHEALFSGLLVFRARFD